MYMYPKILSDCAVIQNALPIRSSLNALNWLGSWFWNEYIELVVILYNCHVPPIHYYKSISKCSLVIYMY